MFKYIFIQELNFWKRSPLPYGFAIFLFAICLVSMWGMAGEEPSGPSTVVQNSEVRLHYLISFINQLVLFMVSAIAGTAIHRDYKSRMYAFLFSYPFSKTEYLLTKFSSAFLVIIVIASSVGLGFLIGSMMPDVNIDALNPGGMGRLLKLYTIFVIPNLFLISLLVFALVAFTRNFYLGFISVIVIVILNLSLGSFSNIFVSILDPLGDSAVRTLTRFWTLSERNTQPIPIQGSILFNRLLWLAVSGILFVLFIQRFHLSQFSSSIQKKKKETNEVSNVRSISQKIKLPSARYSFSIMDKFKVIWNLSIFDFRYVLLSWPFAAILLAGCVMIFVQQSGMSPQHGVPILPTTSEMLRIPLFIFSGVFNLLTFLYVGVLIYRDKSSRMANLVDISPQPDYVLLLSKLLAVFKVQLVLLTLLLVVGILVQTSKGYYRYEVLHYIFELYIVNFIHFAIWACVAIFIHSLFSNFYISFLLLLCIPIGILMMPAASEILKMPILRESFLHFNHVPGLYVGFDYSDFNQYGSAIPVYFFYKFYWTIGAIIFILLANLVWKRGLIFTWKERFGLIKSNFKSTLKWSIILTGIAFVGMGANVYYQEHFVSKTSFTEEDQDKVLAENEKKYGHLIDKIQPRLVKANLEMDIFPKTRDYLLKGSLIYVNKVDKAIDTILVGTSFKDDVQISLKAKADLVNLDKELRYHTYVLDQALAKGDSLEMWIEIKNHPNSLLHDNSRVNTNGTFISSQIIPSLGVREVFLRNAAKRKKYGLPEREIRKALPSDSTLLGYEFFSNNMGRIDYECTVSTSPDQLAFTMGDLVDSGIRNGRRFFHYKSNGPIKNTISWLSGDYSVRKGKFMDIYHHPDHEYNLNHLEEGALNAKEYCEKWFSPLQHEKLSMIEFPITVGTHATLNGNLIPFSESKMLCDIDHEKNTEYNHPYFVAAHEIAHYWWGHKVDPANVLGGQLISEGMAEYISKRVIEDRFGQEVIRKDRSKEQDTYFELRAKYGKEVPLKITEPTQQYLNYVKGGLALTSLSEYIGESKFNKALAGFEKAFRYKAPPFPTSLDFIDTLRLATPDSLLYLIEDLFESITIYDNKITDVKTEDGSTVIHLSIAKYRTDESGSKSEPLPLQDYIRIATYDENNVEEIHLIKVTRPEFKLVLDLPYRPIKVRIDPDVLLIDSNRSDNIWEP